MIMGSYWTFSSHVDICPAKQLNLIRQIFIYIIIREVIESAAIIGKQMSGQFSLTSDLCCYQKVNSQFLGPPV